MERYSHIIRYWITNEKKGNLTHNIKQANTANHIKNMKMDEYLFREVMDVFAFQKFDPDLNHTLVPRKKGKTLWQTTSKIYNCYSVTNLSNTLIAGYKPLSCIIFIVSMSHLSKTPSIDHSRDFQFTTNKIKMKLWISTKE